MSMRWFRFCLVVWTLLFLAAGTLWAQVSVHYTRNNAQGSGNVAQADVGVVRVEVRDSLTKGKLDGAHVRLVVDKDTLQGVTNLGSCLFSLRELRPRDAWVLTSYLGYKSRRDSIRILPRSYISVDVGMQEDPTQLNSIIVKADAVAVVLHGDTTIFNAAAFASMQGDLLRDLLKKFPGVSISGNGLEYQGQKIDRILVNGTNLFGKEINDAMDMVLSSEVQSVKVYEQTAVDDLAADGTQARERVMDIHTWKPMERVGQMGLNLSAGPFLNGNGDWFASGRFSVGNYDLSEKPRVSVSLSGMHNALEVGYPGTTPVDACMAEISLGKDILRKNGYRHVFSFHADGNRSESWTSSVFSPAQTWRERLDTSRSIANRRDLKADYMGNGYTKLGKRWMFRWDAGMHVNKTVDLQESGASSRQDGVLSAYLKNRQDTTTSLQANTHLMLQYRFKKPKRSLGITLSGTGTLKRGSGGRVDTLPGSMSPEWLGSRLRSRFLNPSLSLVWTEPLPGNFSLKVMPRLSYVHSVQQNLVTNLFDGSLDLNNTQDYTHRQLGSSLEACLTYGQRYNGLFAQAHVGVVDYLQMRTEERTYPADSRRHFFRPFLQAELDYSKEVHQVSFTYKESESVPSIEQLRASIDDRNPLFLKAGNPDLAMPVTRTAVALYALSFPEIGGTLRIQADGSLQSRRIANRTVFFDRPTHLEAYSYTAPAGSSLVIPENVDGAWNAGASVSFGRFVSALKTNYSVNLQAGASDYPFYLADVLYVNQDRSLPMSAMVSLGLEKTSVYLSLGASPGWAFRDGRWLYNYLGLNGRLNFKQRFGAHLEWDAGITYDGFLSTQEGAAYHNVNTDMQLSWLFGQENRCRLTLFGADLLNNARSRWQSLSDNCVTQYYTPQLGRSVGIGFQYIFMRR